MLASGLKRQTACRYDPHATALFMECFDPERPVWVLGAIRRDGAEEWKAFAGEWKSPVITWLSARYAAGEPVWFAIGDVREPGDRKPLADDIATVRYIAAHSASPDVFLASRQPHAVYQTVYRDFEGLWRLPEAVPLHEARLVSGQHSAGMCAGKNRVIPHPLYAPLPPSFFPYNFPGGGCMWRMPNKWSRAAMPIITTVTPAPSTVVRPEFPRSVSLAKSEQRCTSDARSNRLLNVLRSHDAGNCSIVEICPGPVITLYVVRTPPGARSNKLVERQIDIARDMDVDGCRIDPSCKRGGIGVELPNEIRETVEFSCIANSQEYLASKGELPIILGVDIGGSPLIVDLAKMPHLLIAGTTGAGKSVGLNAMISSLLSRMTPEQCRFVMIDPKMVELTPYDGIPHLMRPVIVEPKNAIRALRDVIAEMMRRYNTMADARAKKITDYNAKNPSNPMPYLVVVIDEMADLMATGGKEVENAVDRLSRLGRATGVHIIMATQRPDTEVITGTIKANLPNRIAYQVVCNHDSKTILGTTGAENLLGDGDGLYMSGGGRLQRFHGAYISDDEIYAIIDRSKEYGEPDYADFSSTEVKDVDGESWDDEPPAPGASPVSGEAEGEEDGERQPGSQDRGTEIAKACRFLTKALASASRLGSELKAEAQKAGISGTTLDRAADDFLGVKKTSTGFGKPKMWSLS